MADRPSRNPFRPAALLAAVLLLVALLAPWVAAQDEPGRALATAPQTAVTTVAPVAVEPTVCNERTVDIAIQNVAVLYGYQFQVTYDPALLTAVAAFDNTWFDPAGRGFTGPAPWAAACDDTAGICRFARSRGYPDGPLTGSGVIATITFTSRIPATPSVAAVEVTDVVLSDIDGYQILPATGGKLMLDVCAPAPTGYCPAGDADVGHRRTVLLGTGQIGRTRKLTVPHWEQVESLYGQLAALDRGVMKYVRFLYPDNRSLQVNSPTSPSYRPYAVSWWGAELEPNKNIRGQFFWGLKGNQSPRAFVLWPRYATTEPYADVLTLFDDSANNHVYWNLATGWSDRATAVIPIPPTTNAGADVVVQVAIVDNDNDQRPVVLRVTSRAAGVAGVSREIVRLGPNAKKMLNLEEILLSDVPAGTDEIEVLLYSPGPFDTAYGTRAAGGDSAAMIGAAVSYACRPPQE